MRTFAACPAAASYAAWSAPATTGRCSTSWRVGPRGARRGAPAPSATPNGQACRRRTCCTTGNVLIGEDYPAEGPAMGRPITTLVINSALAPTWPAELHAGAHLIGGYARSPHGAITAVEWSADSGITWSPPAEIEPPPSRYSWPPFTFRWTADPGEHTLTTRATDAAGNTQPDATPHNTRRYLFNQPLPHPSRVT